MLGDLKMEVGFMIDGLSAMMMCVVTFVWLMSMFRSSRSQNWLSYRSSWIRRSKKDARKS